MFYQGPSIMVTIIHPNGRWCMTPGPASPGPGRDEHPARRSPPPGDPLQDEAAGWRPVPSVGDPMDEAGEWEAYLASGTCDQEPPDLELDPDPEDPPPPGDGDMDALL